MPHDKKNQPRLYNNVYIPGDMREYLEKTILEIGYKRGRRFTASAFVQFLIKEYGEEARAFLLKEYDTF